MQPLRYSIIACKLEHNNAIGNINDLLYKLPNEMQYFQSTTIGCEYKKGGARNVVVMGYNTFKSFDYKPLKHRINIVCTREHYEELEFKTSDDLYLLRDLKYLHNLVNKMPEPLLGDIFIIGGSEIYKAALGEKLCTRMILTNIKNKYEIPADSFFPMPFLNNWQLIKQGVMIEEHDVLCIPLNKKMDSVQYIISEYTRLPEMENKEECAYLQLLREAIKSPPRGTRNAITRAVFGKSLTFNLSNGFPLLTTKRMPFKSKTIEKELLFFLSGKTDNVILQEQGVAIWNANTTQCFLDSNHKDLVENDMGPMYGHQFRHFGAMYHGSHVDYKGQGIDQLLKLIDGIKTSPTSRRHVMTSLNVAQVEQGCLWPCHSLIIQCFVRGKHLDMLMYQRSADLFLGLPFNIASNAILLTLLAQQTGYAAGILTITIGDGHIYEAHVNQVKTQLQRIPHAFPTYNINPRASIDDYELSDFMLDTPSYCYHPRIKATMIA